MFSNSLHSFSHSPRTTPARKQNAQRRKTCASMHLLKWALQDLNLRPTDYESGNERAWALAAGHQRQFFWIGARTRPSALVSVVTTIVTILTRRERGVAQKRSPCDSHVLPAVGKH